ncbi:MULTISPECIES: ABC transporter permease [Brevibacillus]|jgi:peptide/nickel transport system permease protein|uniref:ABC transporter permease n=1 Tax=Brevibacillus TaxID=55080 RepID=UPI000F077470|nr:ABC transporter permease [Brevibacillus borstelensis]MED1744460.1 ABC transporter permease [Brevibacillus borstelensis]MED1853858.1 ABC transporter permease [Brevibacillus borstelensis]MED1874387.1 ABC transporter permease [Brevibacillus borstelensis]MED1883181.1 ABC transporter permease [Brevibacillus borstelensis]RNB65133.1 ABC transporter permease [Brevibacillus borstelensis]
MNSATQSSPTTVGSAKIIKPRSTFRLLLQNRLAALGLFFIVMWTVAALVAPLVAPYAPNAPDTSIKLQGPSAEHWFGTDNFGRDIFSRVLYGAQISIWTGLIAVGISFCIGVPLGGIAAYYGGVTGNVIMRVMDTLLAFPSLVLAMAIAASIGPGLISAMIAVGIVGIPEFARLMFGQTVSLREKEFVEACRATGVKDSIILFRHIFPNALAPLLVRATLGMGFAILTAASLSFLGLGVKPPISEWGAMISEGREYIISGEWWLVTFPGLAIATSILGFNLLGDGLRDVLDPRLRSSR